MDFQRSLAHRMNRTNLILIFIAIAATGLVAAAVIGTFIFSGFDFSGLDFPENRKYQASVENAIHKLKSQDIKKVTILLWLCEGDAPVDIPKQHYPRLVEELQKLRPTNKIGSRGPWQIYRAIIIDVPGFPAERVFLTKRPDTKMLADAYNRHKSAYFDGTELWEWLISIPEVRDQKLSAQTKPCK
jgi:hypothetical protein